MSRGSAVPSTGLFSRPSVLGGPLGILRLPASQWSSPRCTFVQHFPSWPLFPTLIKCRPIRQIPTPLLQTLEFERKVENTGFKEVFCFFLNYLLIQNRVDRGQH